MDVETTCGAAVGIVSLDGLGLVDVVAVGVGLHAASRMSARMAIFLI
jgi:hypothetical protein